jgi:hypothetical protein
MSWWIVILLTYLVVCWVAWFLILRVTLLTAEEHEEPDRTEARKQTPLLYRVDLLGRYPLLDYVGMALSALIVGPFLPFFLVRCTWSALRADRAWQKFQRTYREAILEPMHPANVPQAAQDHFNQCGPHLERLGFTAAGTYLYKPEPLPIYLQCWLSPKGETVADVALIDDGLSVSFVSVLENGHVLETSCSETPMTEERLAEINQSGRFTAQFVGTTFDGAQLATTHREHLALLRALEQKYACGTLHVPLDQIPAVKRYENTVFGEVLFSLGNVDNQPQPPTLPSGVAKPVWRDASAGTSVAAQHVLDGAFIAAGQTAARH